MIPTPEQIVCHLNRYVIGHEMAKRMLATACYNHLMQCATADLMKGKVWSDNHCLIAGPSGSGKSAMIQVLGEFLGILVVEVDCTNLTPNGYRGRNFCQVVSDLEEKIVKEDKTLPTIVVFEEIDKLRSQGDEAGRYREITQADALRFLDGAACGDQGTLDASRILCIGCGAFEGINRIMDPDLIPRIGFPMTLNGDTISSPNLTLDLKPEHLVQFGLRTEFVGRFSRFSILDPIGRSVMRRIITDSESSVLKRKKAHFELHGIDLVFNEEAIKEVAAMALSHPIGARSLRMILGRTLSEWEFQLPSLAEGGVTEIIFDASSVRGDGRPDIKHSSSHSDRDSLLEARQKAASYVLQPQNLDDDLTIF